MSLLYWAVVFAIISLIAAILGFGVLASAAATVARVLFFVFLVVFVILLIAGGIGSRRAT